MKLLFAATVAALANQASAFKVVLDDATGGTYCLMVVKNDGSTDWAVDGPGNINGLPASSNVDEDGDGSPTIAQNGVNDPTGEIFTAADTAWGTFVTWWGNTGPGAGSSPVTTNSGHAVTIYEAGGATALSTLAGGLPTPSSLSWCRAYSTMAPDHYCKADGAVASHQQSSLETNIPDCCNNNHGGNIGMENTCLEVSTGVKPRGNAKWYIGPNNDKCVRNCDPTNLFDPSSDKNIYTDADYSYECGGLLTWQSSYSDIADCCSNHKADLQPAYCAYLSEEGSAPSPTPAYSGTNDWYSDASNSLCKQDCVVDSGTPACGGVVTSAYTNLFTSAANCCSAELSWLVPVGCDTRSTEGEGEPTELYWPDPSGCRQDCEDLANCASAPSTARIYATPEECCKTANSWVDLDYCVSRANPNFDESSDTSTGTNLWYVSYQDGVCRQDCYPATGNPMCEWAETGSITFFDSPGSCCKALLGSNDEDACIDGSTQGLTISTVPTDKWYVSTSGDQPCAQDCATSGGDACGGIVSKTGVRLYDSAEECCEQAYGWLNEDLCQKLSENEDAPTDLWYVDYGANACKKDCDPTGTTAPNNGAACNGRPDDTSTPMFSSADLCCSAKLNWILKDTCITSSETGIDPTDADSPGTGEWRKNSSWSSCVLDCTAGADIEATDPIVGTDPLGTGALTSGTGNYPDQCDGVISDSSAVFYDASVSNCCKSINWVQEETCVSLSTGIVSEMFFVDPSDRTKCLAHQEAAVTGTTIACDAGVVDGGTAGTAATGVTCEETITTSTKLYSSLEDCCEANVNWDSDACVHRSRGTEATGTNEFYVDWSLSQCVQDCTTEETGSSCGGLAKAWDVLYKDSSSCCGRLSWLSKSKCVYVQT
mmetsp:Transcript_2245/g.3118  ORF Transcript_2245/g.3118 Transcript_2245/m.3118 type:complete len:882 (+) Transcript_2245:105-2750(+)